MLLKNRHSFSMQFHTSVVKVISYPASWLFFTIDLLTSFLMNMTMKFACKAHWYELMVHARPMQSFKVKLVCLSSTERFFSKIFTNILFPFCFFFVIYFCTHVLLSLSTSSTYTCVNGIAAACTACILKTSVNNLSSLSNIFVLVQVGKSSLKDAPCSFRLYSVFLNRCWSERNTVENNIISL